MKKALTIGTLGLVIVAGVGCGSSETTTVTETVAKQTEGTTKTKPVTESSATPTSSTIPDGTWKRGEFTPGTYRAPGGSSCWWEKLEELGEEVYKPGRYGSEETNILVDIDSNYFKTEDCGTWERPGE